MADDPPNALHAEGIDIFTDGATVVIQSKHDDTEIRVQKENKELVPAIVDRLVANDVKLTPRSPPVQGDKSGLIQFDANRGLPAWWDRDHLEWPSFVDNQDVPTSSTTVQNTTETTTVYDPGINTGSLIQGRVYQVDLSGTFSTVNTSATWTIDATVGATTTLAGLSNVPANVDTAPWSVEFTFTVREDGVNGVIVAHTRGLFNSNPDDTQNAEVGVDTTTSTDFRFEVTWSEADPGNIVTLQQAHIKQMA